MSAAPPTESPAGSYWQQRAVVLGARVGIGAILLLVGWMIYSLFGWPESLPTRYGLRRGGGATSVNGTSVLGGLYEEAGHKVRSTKRLSPGLQRADVLVWAPNDYEPPTQKQREWLENWIRGGYGRIVVYIGRDHDAAPDYWQDVQTEAPKGAEETYKNNLTNAQATAKTDRKPPKADEYSRWFTRKDDGKSRPVKQLTGPWAAGIDASKTHLEVQSKLDVPVAADLPKTDAESLLVYNVLLDSDAGPLVTEVTDPTFNQGAIVVVQNGGFILNYPLVNHEHRKLAAKIVEKTPVGSEVVFVESDYGGPTILDKEPTASDQGGLMILRVWPINAIVLHLTLLGIVLCFAVAMIFGRPKELPADAVNDFGRHVSALGQLLAQSKDRAYAQARLQQYRAHAQRASGKSHAKDK